MTARLVYGEDERVMGWAERRISCRFATDAKAIGLARDGRLVAAVVYDTFMDTHCLVHLASDGSKRWLTRPFLVHAMAYPFIQMSYDRITCLVSAKNRDSLRFTRHFGWRKEGVLRAAGSQGEDIIVFGMLRRECRWLGRQAMARNFADEICAARALKRAPEPV